jgi:hypothetical protein
VRRWLFPAVLAFRVIAKQFGVSPMTVQNVVKPVAQMVPELDAH